MRFRRAPIPKVEVLDLRPDDLIVITYHEQLTYEQVSALRSEFQRLTGHKRIAVLDHGPDVRVVRKP